MTYNNTLKDNIQSRIANIVKKVVLGGIAIFYLISGIVNITKQYQTLKSAERINKELSERISLLEIEKNDLKRKSEYASSSAYRERQSRNLLGEGRADDYWLIVAEEEEEVLREEEYFVDRKERIISKWWDLFTE